MELYNLVLSTLLLVSGASFMSSGWAQKSLFERLLGASFLSLFVFMVVR